MYFSTKLLQRIEYQFSRYSNRKINPNLKLVPILKRFDLSSKDIKFPVKLPIRHRLVYKPVMKVFPQHQKVIQWERLRPNEILLAFEDLNRLNKQEIFNGLETLAKQPGQQNYDWRAHPWINAAFEDIKKNWPMYKDYKNKTIRLYRLMRDLRNKDPEMQKFIQDKIAAEIHLYSVKDFIYFWEKYYNDEKHFTPEFREDLFKLMELRLRFFSGRSILFAFRVLQAYGKIDQNREYWMEKAFLYIFKNPQYFFTPTEYAEILRSVIMMGIDNTPFYEGYYARILQLNFESQKQVALIRQVITQAQDIFKTHKLQPYFKYLSKLQGEVKKKIAPITKKSLPQIIREDMLYYQQQLKIKQEQGKDAQPPKAKTQQPSQPSAA